VWLTAKSFNELVFNSEWQRDILETTDLAGSARRDREPLSCPHCRGPMQPTNFGRTSGVIVDTCRKHGIWFDVGELRQAVGHLSNHIERADLDARIAVALASIEEQPRPAWHSRLLAFIGDVLSLP
jgi:Zn-finger nucleic acid-binding protein